MLPYIFFMIFYSGFIFAVDSASRGQSPSRGTLTNRQTSPDIVYEVNARVMPQMCGKTYACSITDASWPTNGFSCPASASDSVSDYSFITAQESAMLYGVGRTLSAAEWPKTCPNPSPGSKMMSYSNGVWTAVYSVSSTCNCQAGTRPRCSGATGISNQACNIAMFKFCEMRLGGTVCKPN